MANRIETGPLPADLFGIDASVFKPYLKNHIVDWFGERDAMLDWEVVWVYCSGNECLEFGMIFADIEPEIFTEFLLTWG